MQAIFKKLVQKCTNCITAYKLIYLKQIINRMKNILKIKSKKFTVKS